MMRHAQYAAAANLRDLVEQKRLVLNERQAAERIGVRPTTLRRWRKIGVGPAYVRLGPSRIGYRVEALDAYVAEREIDPALVD
jgi:NADH/NAD ratio-sensing transcriptional regulator Rex